MKKIYLYYCLLLFSNLLIHAQNSDSEKTEIIKYYDGIVAKQKWFNPDNKLDSLKTYYKTGELKESFYYDKGRFHGFCYQQSNSGKILTRWEFDHGDLVERIDYEKTYNEKNKEGTLKHYATIEKCNATLKEKNSIKSVIYRAYSRSYLSNSILAENDFFKLKNHFEKLKDNPKKPKYITSKRLASIYDILASNYANYEQENKAIHYKYLALKTDSINGRLIYNLGSYLVQIKSYNLGIHYLNKVLEKQPYHAFVHWALAIAYSDLENYELALKHIDIAYPRQHNINRLNIGTAGNDVTTIKGYLEHKTGDSEQGIYYLEKALKLNTYNSFAMRYLGEVYYDLEQYEKACEYLTKSKKLGYEEKYDRYDLQYFIDQSCLDVESNYVSIKDLPNVSPNPVANFTEIINYPFKNFKYIVFDYNNNIVLQGISDGSTINVSMLQPGLYVLLLNEGGSPISIKLIKE